MNETSGLPRHPRCGDVWEHYKGGHYLVVGEGTLEETQEPCVIYRRFDQRGDIPWIRPLSIWMKEVEPGTPRFRFLREEFPLVPCSAPSELVPVPTPPAEPAVPGLSAAECADVQRALGALNRLLGALYERHGESIEIVPHANFSLPDTYAAVSIDVRTGIVKFQ